MNIVNFPARFAFVNTDDGTLTPEALRMFRTWFDRIGGPNGDSAQDVSINSMFNGSTADISNLSNKIEDI